MKEFTLADLLKLVKDVEKPELVKLSGFMQVGNLAMNGKVVKADLGKNGITLSFDDVELSTL